MSPILVRPVREQLEHDRVIRLLQAKYKRKFEVAINPGHEQTMPVGSPQSPWYPDLVLMANERTKKVIGVVEVETAESVNHLEAMSQWVAFGKLKVDFHLYVPQTGVESAKRLCTDLQVPATEIWAYSSIGDQIRFTAVQRAPGSSIMAEPREPRTAKPAAEPKPVRAREPQQPARAAKAAAPAPRPKPAARRSAPAPAAKARPAKGRAAAPRRAAAKPARKAASSRAQKRR